jgi:hypothetical protein
MAKYREFSLILHNFFENVGRLIRAGVSTTATTAMAGLTFE